MKTPCRPRKLISSALLICTLAGASPLFAQKPPVILWDGSGGTSGVTDPAYIRDNWAFISARPFDGMIIKPPEGRWLMTQDHNYTLADFRAGLAPLKYDAVTNPNAPHFTNSTFRNNYAILNIRRPGTSGAQGDFFDDAGWTAALAEIRDYAQAVSEVVDQSGNRVFKGILFDNEDYSKTPSDPPPDNIYHLIFQWNDGLSCYYGDYGAGTPKKTFDQYVVQARARFKACYQKIQEGFPGCAVRGSHGPDSYGVWIWRGIGSATNRQIRELMATHGIGLFEGRLAAVAPNNGPFVEGGELYRATSWNLEPNPPTTLYTPDGFDPNYKHYLYSYAMGNDPDAPATAPSPPIIYQPRLLPTSPVDERPLLAQYVMRSFMVTDRNLDDNNNNTGIKNPTDTQAHLTYAIRRCDLEVVYYAQEYDWLSSVANGQPLPPQTMVDAINLARATGSSRLPGTSWYSKDFTDATGWTNTGGTWSIVGGAYQKSDNALNHSRITGTEFPSNPPAGDALTWTDYSAQVKVKIVSENGTNSMAGLLARYQSSTNFIAFRLIDVSGTKKWDLSKVRNGTWTSLGSLPYAWAVGTQYVLKLVFDGWNIQGEISSDGGVSWTQVVAAQDYTLLSGKVGVIGQDGTSQFDDIKVTYAGPDLVGHWKFNEGSGTSAADSSGKGNTGTLQNGPVWTTDQFGTGALQFDGGATGAKDDVVNCGTGASVANLPSFTAAAWIKPTSTGEASKGRIIDKTTSSYVWAFYTNGTNELGFNVSYSTTSLQRITTSALTMGAWNHVAVTWDGSSSAANVKMYVNGTLVTSYATSIDGVGTRTDDSTAPLCIGSDSLSNRTFDGLLDDVRLYSGVLSQPDIQALANTGAPAIPGGLTATTIAYNQINLAWNDVANESGYRVERKKGVSGTYAEIGTTGVGVVTYNDTTVGAGTQYYYRVRAYNGSGNSAYSTEATATSTEITSGRIGHWKLDEGTGTTTADSSGTGNTGNLGASPANPTWLVGAKIGNGLTFDGVDDVVNCGNATNVNNLTTMTAAAWIKATSMGEMNLGRIIDKTATTFKWCLRTEGTNQIGFHVDYATTDLDRVSKTNAIATGSWYHVLVTWTGSATATNAKIYVNGTEVSSYTTTTNGSGTRPSDSAGALCIGSDNLSNRTFNGSLDDVRLYNRVLSAAEITAVYRAGL